MLSHLIITSNTTMAMMTRTSTTAMMVPDAATDRIAEPALKTK